MLRRFTKVQHAAWTLRINVLEVCVTSVVPAEPKQIGLLEKLQSRLRLDASRSRTSEFSASKSTFRNATFPTLSLASYAHQFIW
jgi:hypothetical protein